MRGVAKKEEVNNRKQEGKCRYEVSERTEVKEWKGVVPGKGLCRNRFQWLLKVQQLRSPVENERISCQKIF